jgi:hypothetical protein
LELGILAMENRESTCGVIRKIGLLAILGFGVVVLSGPILAILSIVLSFAAVVLGFAFVGFVVWSCFQFLIHGRQMALENIQAFAAGTGHALGSILRTAGRVIAFPVRALAFIVGGILFGAGFLLRQLWHTVGFLSRTALLVAMGVVLGLIVGAIAGVANHNLDVALPTNALIGGGVALVASVLLTLFDRKPQRYPRVVTLRVSGEGTRI